ncbi:uncharacterized protein LOC134102662 isoform X2 [Sardina pilchardus]
MADRISGDGFEEELKKEGYKVTSNVDHEYNELCITGEVDLLSWGHRCDDTNNKNGPKSNAPPTARPNSSVKSNNSGRAAGDTKQKVHPEGNQKPRAEPSCLAEQFKIIKGIDASAQSKMLNALLVKEANLITQVQSQVKSVPLCPTSSLPIQKATDMRTRPPEAPKKATNPGSKGTTTTYACVHPLRDPPMNHINTSAQHEVKPSACSTTMAAQTNPSGTTTDAATEHLSAQLRDSSLGASDGPTEDRKRWASYESRDGARCPPPPNSAQSQSHLQQQPETRTGPARTLWYQPSGAYYYQPPPPPVYGPSYGWYPPGTTWVPPQTHLSSYQFCPPQRPPWCTSCSGSMQPNMGRGEPAMSRSSHGAPPGYSLRACAHSQVAFVLCQNTPNSPNSTSAPHPVLLPLEQQAPSGCPRSLYPPAFGSASYYPGPMLQREGGMPTSIAPNRSPYNPNYHILPQFNQQFFLQI